MPRRNAAQYPKNIRRRREIWGTIPILTERIFLCYHNKQANTQMRGRRYVLQKPAFREPADGASRQGAAGRLAPEQGAPTSDPVGPHGNAAVTRARACWSLRECALQSAKPGGTAVTLSSYRPGSRDLLPGRFFIRRRLCPDCGGPNEKRRVSS